MKPNTCLNTTEIKFEKQSYVPQDIVRVLENHKERLDSVEIRKSFTKIDFRLGSLSAQEAMWIWHSED